MLNDLQFCLCIEYKDLADIEITSFFLPCFSQPGIQFLFNGGCSEATSTSVLLAVRLSILCYKALTLQAHLTSRAVEALRVPVVLQSLNPAITWLNRELTTIALGLKHRTQSFWQ